MSGAVVGVMAAQKIAAAGESAGGAITWQATGATTNTPGAATQDVVYPASIASGEKLLLIQALRANDGGGEASANYDTPATPSGWTLVATAFGGAASWGFQTGKSRVTVWEKTAAGTESGGADVTITWTNSGASVALAKIVRLSGANAGWQATTATAGDDSSGGTSVSATGAGSLTFLANDLLLAIFSTNSSDGIGTSPTLTATGATLGSVTERDGTTGAAGGNQGGIMPYSAAVSSGSATVAPSSTITWTEGTPSGPIVFVRVRNAS